MPDVLLDVHVKAMTIQIGQLTNHQSEITMNQTETEIMKTHIEVLLAHAMVSIEIDNGSQTMRLTQAALNCANILAAIQSIPTETTTS